MAGTLLLPTQLGRKLTVEEMEENLISLRDANVGPAHAHAVANVTGLQAALDGKAAANHDHALATAAAPGFMSAADKASLDAMAEEVGAWTPALYGATSPGTWVLNPAYTFGRYLRRGRLVFLVGGLKVTSVSGSVGGIWLSGIPFPVATTVQGGMNTAIFANCFSASGITAGYNVWLHLVQGTSTGAIHSYSPNYPLVQVASANIVAGTEFYFAGSYMKAA